MVHRHTCGKTPIMHKIKYFCILKEREKGNYKLPTSSGTRMHLTTFHTVKTLECFTDSVGSWACSRAVTTDPTAARCTCHSPQCGWSSKEEGRDSS